MIKRIKWQKARQDMWRGLSQFNLGHKYSNLIDVFADRNNQRNISKQIDKQNNYGPSLIKERVFSKPKVSKTIVDSQKDNLIRENKELRQHIEMLKMQIYGIQNLHQQIELIRANSSREISRLNKINRHMMQTIAQSTTLIQAYKDQLAIIADNCKFFEQTLMLKYDQQKITDIFSKRVLSQLQSFQSMKNSDLIVERINNLVDQFPRQCKNTFIQQKIKTIKSLKLMRQVNNANQMIQANHKNSRDLNEYRKNSRLPTRKQVQNIKNKNNDLLLKSKLIDVKIDPCLHLIDKQLQRRRTIVRQIKMELDNQLYKLEGRKMNYREIKNKKYLRTQVFQCRHCDSYEEIIIQIFKIVKEYTARIKQQLCDIQKDDQMQIQSIL